MGFDNVELVLREPARLLQYRIRNQQLAYIMEQTAGGDEFLVIFGQIQPVSEDMQMSATFNEWLKVKSS